MIEAVARAMAREAGYGEAAWDSRGFKIDSLVRLAKAAIAKGDTA